MSNLAEFVQARILIVDDNQDNVAFATGVLQNAGYSNVHSFTNPHAALVDVHCSLPDLLILDLHMPEIDGYRFIEEVRRINGAEHVPILVFTADATFDARTHALNLGASDYLTKPGHALEIQLRVNNFLKLRFNQLELSAYSQKLERTVVARTQDLFRARQETLTSLALAAEFRDDDTGKHTQRVGRLSAAIATEYGLKTIMVTMIEEAAPLHDIGKLAIPDSILLKPGKLTPEENEEMKLHTVKGAEILAFCETPVLSMAREVARSHHERWDGFGYPDGLAGDAIPLHARIVSVADAFDAMTNDRPYKRAIAVRDAMAEIEACSGRQFDPNVATAALSVLSRDRGADVSIWA